ncbi:MAG: bifunctional metallophosphatase/5'-nucleotidase [Ignavibacteriales bacterium]|nr:MAG: bifunctional metallophosphatase/5'-nucleotidase [Ignavibacteriales bacterium]
MSRKYILLYTFFIFISAAAFAQQVRIKIFETSDIHGVIFPFDFKNNKPLQTSMAQVHTIVEQERNKKDRHTILLDNGDLLQGQPAVYYYNFEKTSVTHLLADVMNYMKYDAAAIGNHDIETGHSVYDRINSEFDFPWLSANSIRTDNGETYFPPYSIIQKDKIKIAVLGMITPGIPNWLPPQIWEGIEFEDMIQTAHKWIRTIKEKENPDLIVGLFHSGVECEYNNQDCSEPKNENAARLVAEQVPGFDIVFVGHDHKGWNFKVTNVDGDSVLIAGTKSDAINVACADVLFEFNSSTKKWDKKIEGSLIDTKNYPADPEFIKTFSSAYDEIKEYVLRPIGSFTETISTRETYFGDSPFIGLIHRIQLEISGADVSFASPLSFNAQIKEGDIYVKDMFNLYKYENYLYTMSLSGKEIKDYLEYSYDLWSNTMKDENDHLLKFNKDKDGNVVMTNDRTHLTNPYYNFSSAAGINYTVDVTKPFGEKVNIISMSDGSSFDENKIYKAAINSYRGNGGGGHLTSGAKIPKEELSKRIITSTEKDLRYYMMKWIENKKIVSPSKTGNWKFIPEEIVAPAIERDYKLLFP